MKEILEQIRKAWVRAVAKREHTQENYELGEGYWTPETRALVRRIPPSSDHPSGSTELAYVPTSYVCCLFLNDFFRKDEADHGS